jgi:Bromodomain
MQCWLQVIQRPMDLGTIAASLQSGAYAAPQRLLRDVRQVPCCDWLLQHSEPVCVFWHI